MRWINKLIKERFKRNLKEIKINVLYKIVEASEERFKKEPLCSGEITEFSCCTLSIHSALKNRILKFREEGNGLQFNS